MNCIRFGRESNFLFDANTNIKMKKTITCYVSELNIVSSFV